MIYAIIVTYNPDLELLENQFYALFSQVDGLVYVDNGSNNLYDIRCFIKRSETKHSKIITVYNSNNIGLGAAQNQGIDIAISDGIDHVVFLTKILLQSKALYRIC